MEVIGQVPKTALDVFRLLPEGTLCEVIDNVLYMSPAPKYTHQLLLGLLYSKISTHTAKHALGVTLISPCDVYFEELISAVQPDMFFILEQNNNILHEDGYIYGTPDLVIEVLSSDKKRDTVRKKSLYERAGVKEYFIVNPTDRMVLFYALHAGGYVKVYEGEGVFKSALLNLEFNF